MGDTDVVGESDGKVVFSRSILVDFAFEIPTSLKFEVFSVGSGLSGSPERVCRSIFSYFPISLSWKGVAHVFWLSCWL